MANAQRNAVNNRQKAALDAHASKRTLHGDRRIGAELRVVLVRLPLSCCLCSPPSPFSLSLSLSLLSLCAVCPASPLHAAQEQERAEKPLQLRAFLFVGGRPSGHARATTHAQKEKRRH
jgi:hypothetical protein